jgi:hypothetical protein
MRAPRPRVGTVWWAGALVLAAMLLAPFAAAADTIDLSGPWKFKGDWSESGIAEGWDKPEFDDSQWSELNVPGAWEEQGITTPNPRWPSTEENDGYNGFAWYRRHIPLPDDWAGQQVVIRVGVVDDLDWVYLNGKLVGQTTKPPQPYPGPIREYEVPAGVLKAGDNVIAVRVQDTGGKGGILEGPVELTWAPPGGAGGEEGVAPPPPATERRTYHIRRGDFVRVGGGVHVPPDMQVDGDVVAVGGSANIEGHVTGEVVSVGGSVHVHNGAIVDGGATAVGGTVARGEGASIGGQTVEVPVFPSDLLRRFLHGGADSYGGPAMFISGLLSQLALALFVVLLAALLLPQRMEVMARALPANPGWAAFYGVAGIIVMPAVIVALALVTAITMVVLAISIVGILAIPAVAVALAGAILGIVVIAILGLAAVWLSLGRAMLHQSRRAHAHTAWAMLLGMLVIFLLSRLPYVGWMVAITVLIFGFGVALFTGLGAREDWAVRRFSGGRRGQPAPPGAAPAPEGPATGRHVVVRSREARGPQQSGPAGTPPPPAASPGSEERKPPDDAGQAPD